MSGTRADIARAEAEAAAARARIAATADRLRLRLDPRIRAKEAWQDLRGRGEALGDDAVEFAYERPRVVASAAGVILLLLLRRPIFRLARRLVGRRRSKWDAPEHPENHAGVAKPRPGTEGASR
jgi:hypothetical protein